MRLYVCASTNEDPNGLSACELFATLDKIPDAHKHHTISHDAAAAAAVAAVISARVTLFLECYGDHKILQLPIHLWDKQFFAPAPHRRNDASGRFRSDFGVRRRNATMWVPGHIQPLHSAPGTKHACHAWPPPPDEQYHSDFMATCEYEHRQLNIERAHAK